jgi:hypothetical protein
VVADYGPPGSSVLEGPSGYGDLSGVACQEDGDFGVLELTLTADPGFLVVLEGFDLAGLGSDMLVAAVEVRDGLGAELFSQSDAVIVGESLSHTEFRFSSPTLMGQSLTLRVDVSNLENTDSHLVGLDNVQFSQVPASSCVSLAPRLVITRSSNSAVISWQGSGYCLQSAPTLADPPTATMWTTLSGAAPITVPVLGGSQFFRLICPCP